MHHPLARSGVGQTLGKPFGENQVGVVEGAIDSGRGKALGHDRVEASRVQVGGDGQAALLVGGVEYAVESLGGFLASRPQADVVNLCGHRHRSTYADPATMPTRLRRPAS